MTYANSLEPKLSAGQRCVLGTLNQAWPASATMTPDSICPDAKVNKTSEFVDIVQTLSDNGMILYEAFLTGAAAGPRFLDTMITARGKAALHDDESHTV